MQSFTSLDLQQRTGEIQRAAVAEPVVITNHGRPRMVMMTVEEFVRLKRESGESVPAGLRKERRAGSVSTTIDPLAYDTRDIFAAALTMADAALSGKNRPFVDAEIAAVESRYRRPR